MKNMNQKILFRPSVAVGVLLSAVLSTVVFQNCSKGVLQDSANNSSGAIVQVKSEEVAVVTVRQVYASMLNVTKMNIGTSTITPTELGGLGSSISNTGDPGSVNGPMWMAVTSLSGLGCVDVMTSEAKLVKAGMPANFAVKFNLWAPPAMITDSDIQDSINRFARSYWGRTPSSDESATIIAAMSASFSDIRAPAGAQVAANPAKDPVNAGSNRMLYFLCTAMLASMDSHKRVTSK